MVLARTWLGLTQITKQMTWKSPKAKTTGRMMDQRRRRTRQDAVQTLMVPAVAMTKALPEEKAKASFG